jgi:[ribosomal protein S5]-alanine N-acetyltransferase
MLMTSPFFTTPRLLARHVVATDVDTMLAVYGDPQTVRWVGDGQPLNRAQCTYWVEVTHRNYAARGYGMVTLLERHSGDIAGFCGLVHPDGQPEPEIKYALLGAFRGKGLATEAATGLLRYGATVHGLREIIATVAPENIASQRVLLKAGMRAGELRQNEDGSFTQLFSWRPALHAHADTHAGRP